MNFPAAVAKCFRNYVTFSGRAPRSEFWWFQLLLPLSALLLTALYLAAPSTGPAVGVAAAAIYILVWLPGLTVAVRRLHDRNRSGWNILWAMVPVVVGLVLLIWWCQKGVAGENRFGANPLAAGLQN